MSTAKPLPLGARGVVLADSLPGAFSRDAFLVVGFAVAIALGAELRIPLNFTPVPVTAQTFVVLVGAGALGTRRGVAGALVYAVAGFAGVPWFAVSSGATLGYIAGFVVAAAVVGRAAERGALARPDRALTILALASAAVYVPGVSILALVLQVSLNEAVTIGVLPFLLGDIMKVALAAALLPAVQRLAAITDKGE
jgi:biotin transport system substrate-specific component